MPVKFVKENGVYSVYLYQVNSEIVVSNNKCKNDATKDVLFTVINLLEKKLKNYKWVANDVRTSEWAFINNKIKNFTKKEHCKAIWCNPFYSRTIVIYISAKFLSSFNDYLYNNSNNIVYDNKKEIGCIFGYPIIYRIYKDNKKEILWLQIEVDSIDNIESLTNFLVKRVVPRLEYPIF